MEAAHRGQVNPHVCANPHCAMSGADTVHGADSISGAAGAIICNPIEIVKTRLQASSVGAGAVGYQGYQYKGFIDSFRVIVRDEGVKGLWTGTSIR
eukprot:1024299-Rhodomonas_salina.1